MRKSTLLLLLAVSTAFASDVIFFDDFETNPFLSRWKNSPTNPWQWHRPPHWGYISNGSTTSSSISTTKSFKSEPGVKYKLSCRFKRGGGEFTNFALIWINNNFEITRKTEYWKRSEHFIIGDGNKSPIYVTKTVYCGVSLDDLELKKCEVGVGPTSLGKVKALYK